MPYRKAKSIELHETNTIITLSSEGYTVTSPAGRHARPNRAVFQVRLEDIERLAERLGIRRLEPEPEPGQDPVALDAAISLSFLRAYYEVPAGEPGLTITDLECEVLGPNLVDIRVETRRESDQPGSPGAVETITHSGSFTIWWAAEQMSAAEQLFAVAEVHPAIPVEGETPAESETPSIIGNGESDVGVLPPKPEDRENV